MNIYKKIFVTLLITGFVAAAIFLSPGGLPGNATVVKAQGGAWRLKDIKLFRKMSSYTTITSETYDRNGGSVELAVKGETLDLCPGGQEKMRFNWRFPNGISEFVNGNAVTANLEAGVVSFARPCNGSNIALHSSLSVFGSKGQYSPLSAEENRLIDGEKFLNLDDQYYVNASGGRSTSVSRVGVKEWPNNPKYPLAWFEIVIGTRAGDNLRYVYIYELVGAGDDGGNPSGFTVENDVDRMGGDYKDFDLSQPDVGMCQQACANDSKCRAYTYVKPGVQAPNARCWLKSSVPAGYRNTGCITGIKK